MYTGKLAFAQFMDKRIPFHCPTALDRLNLHIMAAFPPPDLGSTERLFAGNTYCHIHTLAAFGYFFSSAKGKYTAPKPVGRKSAAPDVALGHSAVCDGSITLTGTEFHAPLKCPINRIHNRFNKPRKRRIRPVTHSRDMPMFYGIEMNVVDVTGKVQFVANRVLPITPLPDATFASGETYGRSLLIPRNRFRKRNLDRFPTGRLVNVTRWKCPDTIHVIGQHHPAIDMKRTRYANLSYNLAQ